MGATEVSVLRLEELVINAWPAEHTLLYDGWVLRFAGGYTRRANSIHPLYDSTLSLAEKVGACEGLYRQAGLPAIFKLNRASIPTSLDDYLAGCGYRLEAATSVQVASLEGLPEAGPSRLSASPSEDWLDSFCRWSAIGESRRLRLRSILDHIRLPCGFAMLESGGAPVACGLAVLQGELAGLYNIVTDPRRRGQGHGRQVVLDLLHWSRLHGARSAYLSVMQDNAPALRVYARTGFREVYTYWYRVQAQ
jgi:ribosomal protein S18 acetylase RimI-like enzyme